MRFLRQTIDVALLLGLPALLDKFRCAPICGLGQFGIGARLFNRRFELNDLGPGLGKLLIEIRGGNNGENIAFFHPAADIHHAICDVAGGPGVNGGAIEGACCSGKIERARPSHGFHKARADGGYLDGGLFKRLKRGLALLNMPPYAVGGEANGNQKCR